MLVCGFRGTGKDTFFDKLKGKNDFKFYIYKKFNLERFTKTEQVLSRIGIADNLKKIVNKKYNIEFDCNKDKLITKDKTVRDLYIEYAERCLKIDKYYWVKLIKFDKHCCVTDFRYMNEFEYLSLKFEFKTLRVYRSDVEEPCGDVKSEHDLDLFVTDYLVVGSEDEFVKCCLRFRQYNNFVFSEII